MVVRAGCGSANSDVLAVIPAQEVVHAFIVLKDVVYGCDIPVHEEAVAAILPGGVAGECVPAAFEEEEAAFVVRVGVVDVSSQKVGLN